MACFNDFILGGDIMFKDELKKARKEAMMTQKQMEFYLFGVPSRTYEAWEGGTRVPPLWCQALILDRIRNLP